MGSPQIPIMEPDFELQRELRDVQKRRLLPLSVPPLLVLPKEGLEEVSGSCSRAVPTPPGEFLD